MNNSMTVNAFDIGVLDSLTAHIAVLNVQGIIVAVNKAWRQFGTENGLPEPRHGLLGADYLNACKNITNQPDSHEANAAQAGITAVLAGEQQSFYLEYPCHSLNQQRWFSMKVSPLQGSVGGVVVSHENITERKLAEIALRDSESRFSAIIEASPVPMALNDKQGNITYLNHAFIQTLGYTLDDIPTLTNWWSCAYPDPHYQQWVIENWQNHLAEAIRSNQSFAPMEINITCKNGTVRIFMVAASILKNFAGTHLITLYDITEPKLTEESLKASESRWKFAIEGSGGGLWDWNIVNNTAFYSTFWKEMIGYSEDEIGNELEEFEQRIHPEDKSAVLIAVQNCLDGKTPIYQSEYRFCCKNGSYIWVIDRGIVIDRDEEGKPLRMIGTHIDITERKLAEETIQASKAKLEAALASMTDAVFISDAEGQLIEFNEAFATFHRFRNKKECPKMLAEYPHFIDMYSTSSGEFLPWDQRCVPRALRGETGTGVEFTLRHRDTGETWIGSYNYAPIRNDNGVIVGAVVSARDITEHKKVEAALQESEEKLRLFIHYSPSAIAMFDRDMRYLAHSHRWLIDYGLDEQTLVGRSHYEVFPDLPERWKEIHQRSLAGAIEKCERDCFVRANGFVDWIHWEMHPWLTSTGDIGGIILFSEVITERVKIEEALIASEKEFRLLAESMPQIVWITRADGWNIYFNQQWVDYTGLSLEESCGHGWNKPFHPDDQQRAWDAWQNAVNNNATYSLECQLRRTDGVYRWWLVRGIPIFDENGKVYKWFGTCTDIHKLKESEKSLRIAAIAFESQEAMVITDAKQTNLKVNQAFTRMTGYSAEEAVGSTPALLKSGNQDKQFYDTMWEALNRDKFW
ncbi:MAG: PAS domain S-box protein, partial [Methylococcales bacterium]|nr:PAS domain S-box protein [Methylococcales bacterium]